MFLYFGFFLLKQIYVMHYVLLYYMKSLFMYNQSHNLRSTATEIKTTKR
jgi:hypothetical protein